VHIILHNCHTQQITEQFPLSLQATKPNAFTKYIWYLVSNLTTKGKGSPHLIAECRVPELIPVLSSQPAVTWVINTAEGCHYFPPAPSQPVTGLLPISLLGEQRHDGCERFAKTVTRQHRSCDLNPGPSVLESSTLTTQLPSHPYVTVTLTTEKLCTYKHHATLAVRLISADAVRNKAIVDIGLRSHCCPLMSRFEYMPYLCCTCLAKMSKHAVVIPYDTWGEVASHRA